MEHIFISYSRRDSQIVGAYVEKLREQGLSVWQDVSGRAEGIPYSTKWFAAIEEALYTSDGALIFRSEGWEESAPCAKEAQLITSLAIPVMEVNLKTEDTSSPQSSSEVIGRIQTWAEQVVYGDEKNRDRTWMLTAVNAAREKRDPLSGIPRYRRRKDAKAFLKRLENCRNLIEELDYETKYPELHRELEAFLDRSGKVTVRDGRLRIAGGLAVLILVAFFVITNEAYRREKNEITGALEALGESQIIRDEVNHSAVMSLLELKEIDGETYGAYLPYLFENYADVLTKELPLCTYEANTDRAKAVAQIPQQRQTEGLSIKLSQTDPSFSIQKEDSEDGTYHLTLTLNDLPLDYAIQDGYIAVITYGRAYVFDLERGYRACMLAGTAGGHEAVRFGEDGHILVVCDDGFTYEWENPIQRMILNGENAAETGDAKGEEQTYYDGRIAVSGSGSGRIEITDLNRDCYIYANETITEPIQAVWIEEEAGMVYALGDSGTIYGDDISRLMDSYDFKDDLKQFADFQAMGQEILDRLITIEN